MMTQRFVERNALLDVIESDNAAAATYTTGYFSIANYERVVALIQVGTMTASGTLNAKIQQATSAAGAGVKDITGAAITEMTQAGGDSDKTVAIEVRQNDLDLANGFEYVRLSLTTAVAASQCAALLLGVDPRELPVTHGFDESVTV